MEVFIGHVVLSNTTTSLYSKFLSLLECGHQNINDLLEELDIIARVKVMDVFIREIPKDNTKYIEISLNNLNEINQKIHDILKVINKKIEEHNQKYLSLWRTPDYIKELNLIRLYSKTLEKRFELLIRLFHL